MAYFEILRAKDRPVKPWKNGGGVMWDVAASPEDAGMDDFNWRVSIAHIEESRDFSPFPGIDRHFALLEGQPLRLAIGEAMHATARTGGAPIAFSGDPPTKARLANGPVTALNVMTRRGGYSAELRFHHLGTPAEFLFKADDDATGFILVAKGAMHARTPRPLLLRQRDALRWSGKAQLALAPHGLCAFWSILIAPA